MSPTLLAVLIVLAGLAALLIALAVLVKAVAVCLGPLGGFLVELHQLREWKARPPAGTQESPVPPPPGMTPWAPTGRPSRGIAPPPMRDDVSPTSASVPPRHPGDLDWFDEGAAEMLRERPLAPGSRMAAPPPGERIQGEA